MPKLKPTSGSAQAPARETPYVEPERLKTSLQESMLCWFCFGGERAQQAVALIDLTAFEEPYASIAKSVIDYRAQYGVAPGKEHIDDVLAAVASDPNSKQAPLYQRILLAAYKLWQAGLNEEFLADALGIFHARQRLKRAVIGAARRYEQGGADEAVVSDVEAMFGEALDDARRYRTTDAGGLVVRRYSDIVVEPIEWLWPGVIARGKLTVVAGHPGRGKSLLATDIAARVTAGGEWPVSFERAEIGNVIILSAEDAAGDTIKARLEAAGADTERCFDVAPFVEDKNGKRVFSLAKDIERLDRKIEELGGAALITCDPVSAYLAGVDSHRNTDVRAALVPLAELAAKHGCAIIAIHHLRKGEEGEAILKVSGSLAFVAAARAVWLVADDPIEPEQRLLLPVKNNLGPDRSGFSFEIKPITLPDSGIECCWIDWGTRAVAGRSANEVLAPRDEGAPKVEEARRFLRQVLEAGPLPREQIEKEAHDAGISWRTVERAKAGVVRARKKGFNEGWEWYLAAPDGGEAQDRHA